MMALVYGPPSDDSIARVESRMDLMADELLDRNDLKLGRAIHTYRTDREFYRGTMDAYNKHEGLSEVNRDFTRLTTVSFKPNIRTMRAIVSHPKVRRLIEKDRIVGYRGKVQPNASVYKEVYSGYCDKDHQYQVTVSASKDKLTEDAMSIMRENYSLVLAKIAAGEDPTDY